MASEHTHRWTYQQDPVRRIIRRCACGVEEAPGSGEFVLPSAVTALNTISEREQQLAQARALLEAATDTAFAGVDDPGYTSGDPEESQCFFCGGEAVYAPPPHALPWTKPYQHTAECAWVKARAFLAREEPNDGK